MKHGFQISLMLILAGLMAVLVAGSLGKLTPGLVGDRAGLVKPREVPASLVPRGEIARPLPQAEPAQPDSGVNNLRETSPPLPKQGTGSSFQAPVRIGALIKRKNLEVVIEKCARTYGVDEDLIWAVIRQESGFNPGAVSPKGAMGLMQLMPGTAALMGVSDPFDVEQNIAGGVKYLEQCLNQFNQDVPLALAAYNAGPGNVVKYQGCPPFAETRNYVASILQAYAGEWIRDDLKFCRVNYIVDNEDFSASATRPRGLPWRVPSPKWRIATPQCKFESPRWRVTMRPF
jgi:soluble lytic murein transglycosylase-like protein